MTRYFFNIFGATDIFDTEGTVLSDRREVRLYMLTAALELMTDESNHDGAWQMEALDDRGKIVGTMDFGLEGND